MRRTIRQPVVKFTDTDFPALPKSSYVSPINKNEWISKKQDVVLNAPKKDVFEGCCDENGEPVYGKITFVNGDIYRGPILTSFPKEYEEEYEEKYEEECEDDYDYEEDPYENYGEMWYANGTVFTGVFCFGKSVIKNLVKITT